MGGTWWQLVLGLASQGLREVPHVPRDADDGDDAQLHHEKHTI